MMHLIIVCLAIALSAILLAGGLNYFSDGMGIRAETAQALKTQHSAIVMAASSYRTANNGVYPTDINQLLAYMPGSRVPVFPRGATPASWQIIVSGSGNPRLCLQGTGTATEIAVWHAFATFIGERASVAPPLADSVGRHPVSWSRINCFDADVSWEGIDDDPANPILPTATDLRAYPSSAIVFEELR